MLCKGGARNWEFFLLYVYDKVEGFLISKSLGVSSFSNNKFVVLGIQSI